MTVIATAGHVDHGKSSLVLALTGTDPDRLDEEKRRGLTIDLGFANTTLPSGARIAFVDVPGHVRFLGNMLAGVGAVDACLFVVSASEGWKPQSEEHLRILQLLGLRDGVVALTKSDLVDDESLQLAVLDVAEHLEGTFLEAAQIVPVAAPLGRGMSNLTAALDELVARTPAPTDRQRPRLWIDRVFAAKGSGTVVTGTLTDGSLRIDDQVVVEPGARAARVRGIQSFGESVDSIGPGHRVALNLSGIGYEQVSRGDAVTTPGRWATSNRFDASLNVLAALDHEVSHRGAYVAYIGSRETPVKVRLLGRESLQPGVIGSVRLFMGCELPLLPGDRFVLRESGRQETVGGGEILDVAPTAKASVAQPDGSVERFIAERGWVDVADVERLTGEAVEPTVGSWVFSNEVLDATRQRLCVAVDDAGVPGLDVSGLAAHERALLDTIDSVTVRAGRARNVEAGDPFADHPLIAHVLAGRFCPDLPDLVDRVALRELVRRGVLVEREQIVFHRDVIAEVAGVASHLIAANPSGFTVAQLRDETAATRKFALALVAELDATGVTRRRGDLRIAGPMMANPSS